MNFVDLDPATLLVEYNVRNSCFVSSKPGNNYVTISGLEISQAATNWAPPTAFQEGIINVNWSKGWKITNNNIHDSKCVGISLGSVPMKETNLYSKIGDKPGYQYQVETQLSAYDHSWNKNSIGSHLIKMNNIHDCGQAGIVGNLGGAFSRITSNWIHSIGTTFEYGGWEIAAIKLHAPIDAKIDHNLITDNTLGTWIDWQAQGVRISNNAYYNNLRDLLLEVCHGPFIVDNNLLMSEESINEFAQGGAFINNLILGEIKVQSVLNRSTPYHFPHSTKIKGFAPIYSGDDRYIGNIFAPKKYDTVATAIYNGSPSSMKEYIQAVRLRMPGDVELFETVKQPVMIENNAYTPATTWFSNEQGKVEMADDLKCEVSLDNSKLTIHFKVPTELQVNHFAPVTSAKLGKTRISGAHFDDTNGKGITFDTCFDGHKQKSRSLGPFNFDGINEIEYLFSPLT